MDDMLGKLIRKEISEKTYLNGGVPVEMEIGARVKRVRGEAGHNSVKNAIGTVVYLGGYETLIDFDEPVQGHTGSGFGEKHVPSGRGWYVPIEDVELL